MRTAMKLVETARDPSRAALAAAIDKRQAALARAAENDRRIEEIDRRLVDMSGAIEGAQRSIGEAERAEIDHIARGAAAPVMTPREAREALRELQDQQGRLREALRVAEAARADARNTVDMTSLYVRTALAAVVGGHPEVRRFCMNHVAKFREVISERRALEFLHVYLPPDLKFCAAEKAWPDAPGATPWKEFLSRLESDPDAEPPGAT